MALAVPGPAAADCPDQDQDGVCDADDNCTAVANPDQRDTDLDGFGSRCDADVSGDGFVGAPDFLILTAAFGSAPGDPHYEPHADDDGTGIGAPELDGWLQSHGGAPGPSGLACAGRVPCAALPPGPLAVMAIGDSISAGSNDEPLPDDSCEPGNWAPNGLGWRGLLMCRFPEIELGNYTLGGATSYHGLARLAPALDGFPQGNVALVSFHVNDCSPTGCGAVCSGGARDGLPCIDGADCTGGACDTSNRHVCTPAETRENIRAMVDELLARGYQKVLFWKSPGRVQGLEKQNACIEGEFGFGPDALDTLFLVDRAPEGYANEPRVAYLDAPFRDFCPGTGLQGCDPDDGLGDRRAWWFQWDTGSPGHIHPNAWGYMEIGARLGQLLTREPLNLRPPRPSVAVTEVGRDRIAVAATAGPDPDGNPVSVYVWAVPVPRECGVADAADLDFDGHRDLAIASPTAEIDGLTPASDYRVCAVAYDGLQGSWFSDALVVQTLPPDADADGLDDTVESGTGAFVSAQDTGTSPYTADTDGDGVPDGAEVLAGTDPTDPKSFPGAPLLGPVGHVLLVLGLAAVGLRLRKK